MALPTKNALKTQLGRDGRPKYGQAVCKSERQTASLEFGGLEIAKNRDHKITVKNRLPGAAKANAPTCLSGEISHEEILRVQIHAHEGNVRRIQQKSPAFPLQ